MFDFPFTHGSFALSLYCFVLFTLLIVFNHSSCTKLSLSRNYSKRKRFYFILGVAVFTITCFIVGDFYNYQELVHNYDFSLVFTNHGEPIYGSIIKFLDRNYLLFRIVVWGGALILFLITVKSLGLDDYKVLFYLAASYILTFSYARATLAFSIYFLGIALMCTPYHKSVFVRIVGVILIGVSYFFHHSMIIAIAITPIIFVPFNRRVIVIGLFLITLFFALFSNLINSILINGEFLDNEELAEQITFYAERSTDAVNWKGLIYELTNYATFLLPVFLITYSAYFKTNRSFPFFIEVFFKIAFSLALISIMFLFLDIEGKVFFYRVLFITFIPLSIVAYYAASNGIIKGKTYHFLIYIGLFAQYYRFLYNMYLYV